MVASLSESIEREMRLETTPERAFAFWLDPALLVRWMGDRAEIDARPGGRWRLEYGDRYVAAGEILELDPPRRLLLSWGWEKGDEGSMPAGASRVEVTFEPDGTATRLRLRHFDLPDRERTGHAEGWDYFLPRLEAATEAPARVSPGDDRPAGADARAVADVAAGSLVAAVWLRAPAERVFDALASREITSWWVRPGVFDTREWTGDVRPGGRWQASGIGGGKPYTLEGTFVEIARPHRLVHSWHPAGNPVAQTEVTYLLEDYAGGTWLTLRQTGFASRDVLVATAIGWETSFRRLAERLEGESGR